MYAQPESGPKPKLTAASLASSFKKHLPMFVLGFVGMASVRTVGDATLAQSGAAFGMMDTETWRGLVNFVGKDLGSHYFLGTAMAAVGLNLSKDALKGVGLKPFAVGLGGAAVVGTTGCVMAKLLF